MSDASASKEFNKINYDGTNKLFRAIEKNDTQLVREMIEAGVDIHWCCKTPSFFSSLTRSLAYAPGSSPLHVACLLGVDDIVRMLLDNGADPNVKNREGYTPVDYALSSYAYYQNDLRKKEASRFTLKRFVTKATAIVDEFETVIYRMLAAGAKPGLFALPEKFQFPGNRGDAPSAALPLI